MVRPVPSRFPISNKWGTKNARYKIGYHTGTDFAVPVGTRVTSPYDGVVTRVLRMDPDYGNAVIIRSVNGGREWWLCHLSSTVVNVGRKVRKRELVGFSGRTGKVTGPHLHAEERHAPFGYHDTHKPTSWVNG